MHAPSRITPELLLGAYAQGVFPMAEQRNSSTLFWLSPESRGVIPLERFHIPKRLARTLRAERFEVTIDRAFGEVIRACAAPVPGREQSWINEEIVALYTALHDRNYAHSVECWREGKLAGGLYGVRLGGAFFGESMFSRERDASKVALAHLVARLMRGGFTLLDTQFLTDHLARFGAVSIHREGYLERLAAAIEQPASFLAEGETQGATLPGSRVLHLVGERISGTPKP